MNRLIYNTMISAMAGIILLLHSCNRPGPAAPLSLTDTTQTYFSIKDFIRDQILLLEGQPLSLMENRLLNGKADSSLVNFYTMDMGYILKTFLATDISNRKFLGKYKFTSFEEPTTGNQIFMYEAKEPELFTRNLSITIDATNDRILSLYTETAKRSTWREQRQRLLYLPLKVIQIQENQSAAFSKKRDLKAEYRFLQ